MGTQIKFFLKIILLLSLIALTWIIAVWIVTKAELPANASLGDLSSLLFGAASVALFILSFFVAILAIFGWQSLQSTINDRVDQKVSGQIKEIYALIEHFQSELTGRQLSGLGFMIGELSHDLRVLDPTDPYRLEHSIQLCRQGYDKLKDSGARSGLLLMALNNLVFYLCVRKGKKDREFVLTNARELRKAGEELDRPYLLLTYCRAILCYSSEPAERKEAETIAEELANSPIPENQKNEARLYLASFRSTVGSA